MTVQYEPIIRLAMQSLASGNLVRAKSLLHGVAKVAPNHSEINRLLGVCEAMLGDVLGALKYFNKAIKFGPKNSHAYSNRGNIHKAMGDARSALDDYTYAINLDPQNSEAFYNRGLVQEVLNCEELAIQDYLKAITFNPDYVDAYLNLTSILIGLGRFEESFKYLKIISERNPYISDVWLNMGYVLNHLREFNLAIEAHEKALKLSPKDGRIWSNKGTTFDAMGLTQEALSCYENSIRLNPNSAAPYSNRGYAFHKLKEYSRALLDFDLALEINPLFSDAWCNKGMTLMELKRFEEAKQAFFKAIECNPLHASAHLNLGHLFLGLFEFKVGWEEYEWRWKSENNDSPYFISDKPLWSGQNSSGNIFVWSEQGIGDQILYSTLLPELSEYAQSITVSTDKKLIPLLKEAYENINFVDKKDPLQDQSFDYHIPIASLPRLLRPSLNSFLNADHSYLKCNEIILQSVQQALSKKIKSGKKICGLSWSSGNQRLGIDKSIPILGLESILSLEEYEFIDLQYGNTEGARRAIFDKIGVTIHKIDQINNDDDLVGLLALINICDVVVTVSNTTAHLAAASGKEILLLLPYSTGKFWYWNSYNCKNLWYEKVKVFEQIKQGSWVEPLATVREYMEKISVKNGN